MHIKLLKFIKKYRKYPSKWSKNIYEKTLGQFLTNQRQLKERGKIISAGDENA